MNANAIQAEWTPFFQASGETTITWGTEGTVVGGYVTGATYSYIVTSVSVRARIEEINIEQGSGFEAAVILLNKGYDFEVEVVDDTSIAPPTIANNPITFSSPFQPNTLCLLVGYGATGARKREGMRTFSMKTFNAITGAH